MSDKLKIFVYSGTHWDREWYQSFQGFRHRLVEMADILVDGLERVPEYGVFHFDGQTIVLEDILRIAPDLEPRLKKQIQSGRIQIGPWYCMPDEFIVSGESLIRNLKIGRENCHKWGVEPSADGYICDIFGHTAQMPQIFDGMDIHHTVLCRGTNLHTTPMHFRWQSPDGTDVTAFRLYNPVGYGDLTSYAATTTGPSNSANVEDVMNRLREYVDVQIANANIPVIFLLDALDHNNWHEDTPVYVQALKNLYPDAEVYHTDIMDMCRAVDIHKDELTFRVGELNEPAKVRGGFGQLITNVVSSRYPIKKQNDILQNTLEKYIQPFYAFGKSRSREGFLDMAQRYLIMNHPHDSICGCSIDQVHRDMNYRFDQSRLIMQEISNRVVNTIRDGSFESAQSYCEGSHPAKLVRVYNPLPYGGKRMIEADIAFPKDYKKYCEPFGYEWICSFRLYDKNGVEFPYGIIDINTYGDRDVYRVQFETELTPMGLCDIEVRPMPNPSRFLEKLRQSTYSAENDFIKLEVNSGDGTISIYDKKTGITYPSLLGIIDNGEIGDGWYHCDPRIDRTVAASLVSVEKCRNDINGVTFRINLNLHVPQAIVYQNVNNNNTPLNINPPKRSECYVDMPITHYVTITRTEREVKVKTIIDNRALDHRIKLRLSTAVNGTEYYSSQAFAFVQRNCTLDTETAEWMECEIPEKHFEGMIAKFTDNGGMAFASRYGLHESAVYENGDIDITLLRCYRKTVGTNGEPDGELIGIHEFEYMLAPQDAKQCNTLAQIARLAEKFRTGTIDTTIDANSGADYKGLISFPEGGTFVYSTSEKTEQGSSFRFFNCSDNTETETLSLPANTKKAYLTYIDGRRISELEVIDGKVTVTAGKWKIVTIETISE